MDDDVKYADTDPPGAEPHEVDIGATDVGEPTEVSIVPAEDGATQSRSNLNLIPPSISG
jgi:hypothetical protein